MKYVHFTVACLLITPAMAEENIVVYQSPNQITLVDVDSTKHENKTNIIYNTVHLRSKNAMIGLPQEAPKVYILYSTAIEQVDCHKKRIRQLQMSSYGPDDVQMFSVDKGKLTEEWMDVSKHAGSGKTVYEFLCLPSSHQYKSFGKMQLKDVITSVYSKQWP